MLRWKGLTLLTFSKDIFLYFFIKLKICYPSYSIYKIECANPLTPTSDQDTISPYNIKQVGDENKEKYQLWDN